jgi:hypothetical protein
VEAVSQIDPGADNPSDCFCSIAAILAHLIVRRFCPSTQPYHLGRLAMNADELEGCFAFADWCAQQMRKNLMIGFMKHSQQ